MTNRRCGLLGEVVVTPIVADRRHRSITGRRRREAVVVPFDVVAALEVGPRVGGVLGQRPQHRHGDDERSLAEHGDAEDDDEHDDERHRFEHLAADFVTQLLGLVTRRVRRRTEHIPLTDTLLAGIDNVHCARPLCSSPIRIEPLYQRYMKQDRRNNNTITV